MENNETVFLDGFTFERPREGSPAFVRGRMGINVEKAIAFLQAHKGDGEWLNADLLTSKDGQKLYWKLNTFKPKPKEDDFGDPLNGGI